MAMFLKSIQAKVTAAIITALLCVVGVNNIVLHDFALKAQFEQLREELKVVARTAAVAMDADVLMAIPLKREGADAPQYKAIQKKLIQIRKDNPRIAYVYVMTQTDRSGIWQFIVDADPIQKRREGITSYPGDKYDTTRFPQMTAAWQSATADKKLEKDQWGLLLSGYAPIKDLSGKTVAVIGVDMLASDIHAAQRALNVRALFVLLFGILFSVVVGIIVSRQLTKPVKHLVEGTRRISRGDLGYRVKVRGNDEIAELSSEFNLMTRELSEARKKNSEYFYGVIQSMVRVVEAKDKYTFGHSERVAEYAVKIARRMGFPSDDLEMLKQVAVLHDIGKLGIQDAVLNKPGKLSMDEWNMMRLHPVMGEEILKPVLFDLKMLAIIRGHHERYDGAGYPDGLCKDQISTMAQILSVADAYDAMTSSRAYRPVSMSMKDALIELQKNKGSQFDGRVVDAFCEVLTQEEK